MLRPNQEQAHTLTQTQFLHEWVAELRRRGWTIADAGRGRPSYPADRDAIAALRAYAEGLETPGSTVPYGSSATGEPHYRAMAAEGLSREYNLSISQEEVIFTPGGQFGLAAAFYLVQRLLPGSAIITAAPWYVNHYDISRMFLPAEDTNRVAIHGKTKPPFVAMPVLDNGSNGKVTPELLKAAIEKAQQAKRPVGAFLFTNPANPLGTVMRRADWLKLVPILDAHPEVPILLDEAFAEIVFCWDNTTVTEAERFQVSLLHAAPHLKDRCLIFRSGTKALALSGERLAVTIAPKRFIGSLTAFQSRLLGNSPISLQCAMAAALHTMTYDKKRAISNYYQQNMKTLCKGLERLKLTPQDIPRPEGCFYALADLSALFGNPMPDLAAHIMELPKNTRIETDMQLAISLLTGLRQQENHGLAMMPGCSFGLNESLGYTRISASSSPLEVQNVLGQLEALIN